VPSPPADRRVAWILIGRGASANSTTVPVVPSSTARSANTTALIQRRSDVSEPRGNSRVIRGAVEQRDAQTLLTERNAPPDRNVPDTQNAGGSGQAARAHHS
jgi:hypothetical protein